MKTPLLAQFLTFALAPALLAQFPLPNAGVPAQLGVDSGIFVVFAGERSDVVAVTRDLYLLSNGDVFDRDAKAVVLTGATAINGGLFSFIAVKNGRVVVAGRQPPAALTPPPAVAALTDVVSVFCGQSVGVAKRSTGEVVAWSGGATTVIPASPTQGMAGLPGSNRFVAGARVFDGLVAPAGPVGGYSKAFLHYPVVSQFGGAFASNLGPIAVAESRFGKAAHLFILVDGEIRQQRANQIRYLSREGEGVEVARIPNAVGLSGDGIGVWAILKPNEVKLVEGTRILQTKPGVDPEEARHAARAPRVAAALAENALENRSAVFFGRVAVGTTSAAHLRTLTITNEGAGTLTLGAVTVDGAHPGDFVVTPPAVSTLGPRETAEFTVQFTPGAAGQRTATLHLASDDADEASFDVELNGFGQPDNAAPLAVVDTLTAPAGGGVTFTRLLGNDSDADGDPVKLVSVAAIDGTTQGGVRLEDDGTVAYTSPPDVGTDSFAYTITDGTVTQTGTVNVNVVDPVPLAAGKTFRGAEDGDMATVTFGKLTPAAAAARLAVRTRKATALTTSGPKLAATFTEVLDGRTYRGRVVFDADDNDGEAVLNGSADNVVANFEITVDEDGAPRVFADGIELLPDLYDARHPAPPAIAGIYTMALPGASLGEFALGVGDSVASVILRRDGVVTLRGFMADGQSFIGSAHLGAGNVAPFDIPLYRGRVHGRFTGDLVFDPDNADGSLTGRATWRKPPGIRGLPMPDGFIARGDLIGGFYTPDELPATLAFTFSFGEDAEFTDFLATGTGTLAKNFTLNGTRADTTAFRLDSHFARSTGLITGARPRRTTTEPLSLRGVILQEQAVIVGSAVFLDPGIEAELFTAPVTAPFPP